jgi:hypothetical protein
MIAKNVNTILKELPPGVGLEAAAKMRTAEEVMEAINAGVEIIGENYVQESLKVIEEVGKDKAKWHFIGHLQKNKINKVIPVYNMIESVDSLELAEEIDERCKNISKTMPILIEVNSGREPQKFGVMPEDTEALLREIARLSNVKIMGLMTMGPRFGNPEASRPYFIETKKIFDKIKSLNIPNVEMRYLSMGMTNSYQIAIEEGANLIRIGTKIFGPRGKR